MTFLGAKTATFYWAAFGVFAHGLLEQPPESKTNSHKVQLSSQGILFSDIFSGKVGFRTVIEIKVVKLSS